MEGQPLLGVLRGLILDEGEQAEFTADPSGYMQRAGYDDISEEDLGEAVSLVADTLPPDVAHAVNTAAAPPDGAEDDGGALGMLGRLAEIDTDQIAPLEVPEPMADYAPDDGLGWAVEDDSTSSFGDVDQGFDDLDPFAEEAAEPGFQEGDQVPFSQIHNVDDDPVDVDVDVDAAHRGPAEEDGAIDFGEGSTAPDVADDGTQADTAGLEGGLAGAFNTAADAAAGADDGGGELGDDAFGSDASFDETGDTAALDDADAYDDGSYDDAGYDDGGDTGEDALDDGGHTPDDGGDDVGLF